MGSFFTEFKPEFKAFKKEWETHKANNSQDEFYQKGERKFTDKEKYYLDILTESSDKFFF